ncbi:Lrp/AsnC family transcriptional regulator [Halobacteriales archaeon QS_8_69_26]|nr:MAG: Lrp/AsnC family transcriptional regulator [Halobacteriales archaeon QS_8_69_26]
MTDAADAVLDLLLENARYTTTDIARMTGLDEPSVSETIQSLEDEGVIRGYRAVVDWSEADRERVQAEVEVNVTLDRETGYEDVAERLVEFDEVTSLRLVSGDYDFDMEVEADSMRDVSAFVSEQVAPMPAVDGTVTHLVMASYKEGGMEMDDDDDDRLSVSP